MGAGINDPFPLGEEATKARGELQPGASGPFPPGNSSQPPGLTDPDSNSVHVSSGWMWEGDPPGLGCLPSLSSFPYRSTHYSGLPWTEPGDANMDDRLSGRQALSSGLWASCILCSPVGGLRHPLPGDKRPLLLPGSRSECSKGSLRTTESSLDSAGQPHPPCSALGFPEGTFSDKLCPGMLTVHRVGSGGGRRCRLNGLPSKEQPPTHTGAQLPEKWPLYAGALGGGVCWNGG